MYGMPAEFAGCYGIHCVYVWVGRWYVAQLVTLLTDVDDLYAGHQDLKLMRDR
jgi:hypothetical protein